MDEATPTRRARSRGAGCHWQLTCQCFQAAVLPVSEKFDAYATRVRDTLFAGGLRVEADLRSDKVGAKIRDATMQKVPYMLIVGGREAEAGTVSVRDRQEGDLGPMQLDETLEKLKAEIDAKLVRQVVRASAALGERSQSAEY